MPNALVTGLIGHGCSYRAQFLLRNNDHVLGVLRCAASSDVSGGRLHWLGGLEARVLENLVAVHRDRRFGL